ncbi:hypothetical protein B0T24DRAFT_531787 [Lasiosphaeria ovina]|uniref:Protamine P1 n=1 Tax=Lasiosphaeria ovina TaxID=92902 RepID=A0AAE0K7L1_9PEZI|nr:hypothetical protein B0T24DRAFT_531787 [Lasiosphaeria ovina]
MKRRCLSPSRTWLLPDNFADEPVYCEAVPKSADDVLYSGSEDEAYDNSDDRRARYETQAQRFLNGHEPVLLSASLRGPFGGKYGWTNPWHSTSASALHQHHVESSLILGTATSSMPPPESVRPKSPARAHRFLSNESLCRVNSWRQGITTDICADQASSSQGASTTESTVIEDSILPGTQSVRGNGTSRTPQVLFEDTKPLNNLSQPSVRRPSGSSSLNSLPTKTPEPSSVSLNGQAVQPAKMGHIVPQAKVLLPAKKPINIARAAIGTILTPCAKEAESGFQSASDRSFRFRRRASRDKVTTAIPTTKSSTGPLTHQVSSQTSDRQNSKKAVTSQKPESTGKHASQLSREDCEEVIFMDIAETHKPDLSTSESERHADDLNPIGEDGTAETTPPIDGPTLVPSESSASLPKPPLRIDPSVFLSTEKFLNPLVGEKPKLPRTLLWPSSQQPVKSRLSLSSLPAAASSQPLPEIRYNVSKNATLPDLLPASARMVKGHSPQVDTQPVATPTARGEETLVEMVEQNSQPNASDENLRTELELETSTEKDEIAEPSAISPMPTNQSPWYTDEIRPRALGEAAEASKLEPRQSQGLRRRISQNPSQSQSPWAANAHVAPQTPMANAESLLLIAIEALERAGYQSPWRPGGSQIPVSDTGPFSPISLPPIGYDLPNATDSYPMLRQASYRDEDVDMANSQPHTKQPSTPETKRSSLPTPDFTLSIKSFREFMTPSPQRPTKIRRISTADGGYLPSTQILVDTAISNPWAIPSTKKRSHNRIKKHVTWAPLPGEEGASPKDGDEASKNSLHGAELPYITTVGDPAPRLPRTASPPPLIVAVELPARDEKFAKHFAAMAGRRLRTTIPRTSLLPSASQQFCASPAVDAMANAFIQADKQATDGTAAVQRDGSLLPLDLHGNTRMEEDGAQGGDRLVQHEEESDATDDVNAVLENIGDFLESWDIDAELAKAARADNSRGGRDNDTPTRMPRSVLAGSSTVAGLPGLMDDGVWD